MFCLLTCLLSGAFVHATDAQDCGSTYKAENLRTAMSSGTLTEAEIDVALGRAMRMRMRAGMFDPPSRVPSVVHLLLLSLCWSISTSAILTLPWLRVPPPTHTHTHTHTHCYIQVHVHQDLRRDEFARGTSTRH